MRGIDILSKHIFLVSLPAIAKNSNIAIPQNKFKLCLAKITFSYTENKPICNIESTNKKDALKEAISSYAAVHKIPKKESVVSVDVAHDPLPNTIVVLSDKECEQAAAAMTAAAKQHEAEWTVELVRRALAQEAAQ